MSQFKNNVKKENYRVVEWMEEITQARDNFEECLRHQFSLYDTSTYKEFSEYMKKKRNLFKEGVNYSP